jgi:hypothetical protein
VNNPSSDDANHIRHPSYSNEIVYTKGFPQCRRKTLSGVTNNGAVSRDVDKRGEDVPVQHLAVLTMMF